MQAELLQKTDDAIIELVRDELSELIGLSGEQAVAKSFDGTRRCHNIMWVT